MSKKLSIISFSGDFDKLTAVFTLPTGAAAVGYEVNLFVTFWELDAIKKKQGRAFLEGTPLTKIFGFLMGGLYFRTLFRLFLISVLRRSNARIEQCCHRSSLRL
ncbi:MAG: DsrE/DsrF/DrsH-like family protein [Bacteroidales bacterium]|jgi:peroxiredoxin family protein|nr:DsrE/DsrF/DrsH-like family protein [Bacteroidales bacterium]